MNVLSFCDVPMLGALVPMSKNLNRLAKQDCLWEPYLNHLLRVLFHRSLQFSDNWLGTWVSDPATPLYQRQDWRQSTALLRWFHEAREGGLVIKRIQKNCARFLNGGELSEYKRYRELKTRSSSRLSDSSSKPANPYERFDFLFTNVPIREYYHRVGSLAHQAVSTDDREKFCRDCCAATYTQPTEFRSLPKIQWFC